MARTCYILMRWWCAMQFYRLDIFNIVSYKHPVVELMIKLIIWLKIMLKKIVIFIFKLNKFNQPSLNIHYVHRSSYSISAIKIEIVPFCRVIFKSKDPSENLRGFFFRLFSMMHKYYYTQLSKCQQDRKSFYAEICCYLKITLLVSSNFS